MAQKKDPFGSIATPGKAGKKASNKIAAAVNKSVRKAVDTVINIKAKIKALKADQDVAEAQIIDHVKPQQETHARQGNYSKSFQVEGEKGTLTYTTGDKFSIEKDEAVHEAIKQLLGADFDKYVRYVRSISLKPAVQENSTLINKIVKAVTDAGIDIADAFEVKDVLVHQPGLDESQFDLDTNTLAEFRTLVKQYKAALK